MENSDKKRKVSSLIPYKIEEAEIFVYLQKRADHAERHAGYFAFFGGGVEKNETPEETLKREIQEELNYIAKDYHLLGIYDFFWGINNVFMEKVGSDFESKITVKEGDYGKFFSEKDVRAELKLSGDDKGVLNDFFEKIRAEM